MPHDRLLHPRLGHSRKVAQLTDLEYRVWIQCLLSADDFGVLKYSALVLQADNQALAKRPRKRIEQALQRVIEVGLLKAFPHQDARYLCDPRWQEFQKVQYPKVTLNPMPTPDVLAACHPLTRELFRQCFGKPSTKFRRTVPEDSEKSSGDFFEDSLSPSRAREEANGKRLMANGKRLTANAAAGRDDPAPPGGGIRRDRHLDHAVCDASRARCVPNAVHRKLTETLAPRYGGDRAPATAALQAWYPTVWATLPADFVMGDAFKFWQGRFDSAFASNAAVPPTRPPGCHHTPACADEVDCTSQRRAASRQTGPAPVTDGRAS